MRKICCQFCFFSPWPKRTSNKERNITHILKKCWANWTIFKVAKISRKINITQSHSDKGEVVMALYLLNSLHQKYSQIWRRDSSWLVISFEIWKYPKLLFTEKMCSVICGPNFSLRRFSEFFYFTFLIVIKLKTSCQFLYVSSNITPITLDSHDSILSRPMSDLLQIMTRLIPTF